MKLLSKTEPLRRDWVSDQERRNKEETSCIEGLGKGEDCLLLLIISNLEILSKGESFPNHARGPRYGITMQYSVYLCILWVLCIPFVA